MRNKNFTLNKSYGTWHVIILVETIWLKISRLDLEVDRKVCEYVAFFDKGIGIFEKLNPHRCGIFFALTNA